VLRSSPLRRGPWPSRCVHSVAPSSAQSCTASHSRFTSLHLGGSLVAQSPLRLGPWPSRCVKSVALSSAESCTADHSRLSSLHLGESRLAQLAAASRDWAVPLRAERRNKSSSELHSGPQPPRDTPPRSVAPCAARRCVAALGCPAPCTVSRLVQLKAARRPTAASRLSTSERGALRSSPLRRGPWPSRCVHSVALSSAQSCTAAHSRLATLHLGASRLAQLAAASRHLAVPLRAQCRA